MSSPAAPTPLQLADLLAAYEGDRDDEAEAEARKLVEQYPAHPFSWKILALVLARTGRAAEALACLEHVLILAPGDANTHNLLGNVLCSLQRQTEACSCYEAALALEPSAVVLNNLGTALQELGRNEDALVRLRQALALDPGSPDIHYNIGNAELALDRVAAAESSYLKVLALQPRHRRALLNLATLLRDAGRNTDAETCLKQALLNAPDDPEVLARMAGFLRDTGRNDESADACRRGLARMPEHPACLVGLARIESDNGHFAAAETAYRRALAARPLMAEALAGLARLQAMTREDAAWLNDARRALAATHDRRSAIELNYAIGKYYDDVGDYDAAFDHYRQANTLQRKLRPSYDRQRWAATVDRLISESPAALLAQPLPETLDDRRPVFVVGLPRTGTSLVEQIIAAHPRAFGAGELTYWPTRLPDPLACLSLDSRQALATLASDYLRLIDGLAPGAKRIVDKLPGNFVRLAQLRLALPGALFVHLRRHPVDTCLSIYFQNFNASHLYATDLGDLAFHYHHYHRLMEHWCQVIPKQCLLELDYEVLVDDQEGSTRRLLAFLDLPWDDACLDFAGVKRRVGTASNWQVRQPIYRSSRARWRHYEANLGPLTELLSLAAS